MNQTDARNFILALNAIVPYVPPMLMAQVSGSSVCKAIEQIANTPDAGLGEQGTLAQRPKPHAVPS